MEVSILANIKSAKKRILVNRKKALRNKAVKSSIKTQIKKVDSAIAAGNKETAVAELSNLQKVMSMATSKGILKKNTTSRKISRMATAVNKIGK